MLILETKKTSWSVSVQTFFSMQNLSELHSFLPHFVTDCRRRWDGGHREKRASLWEKLSNASIYQKPISVHIILKQESKNEIIVRCFGYIIIFGLHLHWNYSWQWIIITISGVATILHTFYTPVNTFNDLSVWCRHKNVDIRNVDKNSFTRLLSVSMSNW